MAQSYQLIQAITVGSGGAASIQFNNIPQNYTDLVLKFSLRTDIAGNGPYNVGLRVNGSSSNIYSTVRLYKFNSSVSGLVSSAASTTLAGLANAAGDTANTFTSSEFYLPNYTSSNNKSGITDTVQENNGSAELFLAANLMATTSAVTSIELLLTGVSYTIVQYSTAYLYGIGGSRASGGTITADANYTYHTFTSSGTFTTAERIRGAEALVIAGGGGGGGVAGSSLAAGGGGAGGLRTISGLLLPAGNTYTVTIGAGGSNGTGGSGGGSGTRGTNGSNSTFSTITASGGGPGASRYSNGAENPDGGSGGSGGGGRGNNSGDGGLVVSVGGAGNSGSYSPAEGTSGAAGNATTRVGGGGGGASSSGSNSGRGGTGSSAFSAWGLATSTGQNVGNTYYYAGGGTGGTGSIGDSFITGGEGGGGAGGAASVAGTAGTANTGGGGGGAGWIADPNQRNGGSGGSGLVIIRYPNS